MTVTWTPYITAQEGTELLGKKKTNNSNSCINCTLLEKTGLEYKSALKQTMGRAWGGVHTTDPNT